MTPKQLKALRAQPVPATGNRLEAAFDIFQQSQMACARFTGFSPQYVSDVKAGRIGNITVENAHKFAAFFGCLIEDLFPSKAVAA